MWLNMGQFKFDYLVKRYVVNLYSDYILECNFYIDRNWLNVLVVMFCLQLLIKFSLQYEKNDYMFFIILDV